MNGSRFDALAKLLAVRPSRRQVMRALTGGLVATVTGARATIAVDCGSDCDRLSAGPARDQCVAACTAAQQARATAEAEANQARATAEAQGQQARATADAIAQQARTTTTTAAPVSCGAIGAACTAAADCCSRICTNAVCATCPPGYRECDGVCYPGGCCTTADCGLACQVCTHHVCLPCEAAGLVCQNGTCVPTTTTTTTTTTPPLRCPAGSSLCQGSGALPTCCAEDSPCGGCSVPGACVCCPPLGGNCIYCPAGQFGCCNSTNNTCTCCAAGQTCCGGTCTDLRTDPANCGACGHACETGQPCRQGNCVPTTTTTTTTTTPPPPCAPGNCRGCCDPFTGVCLPGTSAQACGRSGLPCFACGATETCPNGACVPACGAGSVACVDSGPNPEGTHPTCCGGGSFCDGCFEPAGLCFCCAAEGGQCHYCPPPQYACCTSNPQGNNTCTCCEADQTCSNGTCAG